jgi:hypothetical protein
VSSGMMRAVILGEYFLASSNKAFMPTSFHSASFTMEELTLS